MRSPTMLPFSHGARTASSKTDLNDQNLTSHSLVKQIPHDTFEKTPLASQVLFAGASEPSLSIETKNLIDQNRTTLYKKLNSSDRYKVLLTQVNQELSADQRITIAQLKAYLPNPDEVFLQAASKHTQVGASSLMSRSGPDAVALCMQEYLNFYERHGNKSKNNKKYETAKSFYAQVKAGLGNLPDAEMPNSENLTSYLQNTKSQASASLRENNIANAKSETHKVQSESPMASSLVGSVTNAFARSETTSEEPGHNTPASTCDFFSTPINTQNGQNMNVDDSESELSDVSESLINSFNDTAEKTTVILDDSDKEDISPQADTQTSCPDSAKSSVTAKSSDSAGDSDSDYNSAPKKEKSPIAKAKQPSTRIGRFSAGKPQVSDHLMHLLDAAAKVDDVEDERVAEARRTCRLEGMAYAKSKSRDENSQTYKKALADYGKSASAYVKERVNQHLTAAQGHSDPKVEKKHGLRYLFRRPQKFDASGNSMGKYDEDFNDVQLSNELQSLLRVAALIEDEDNPSVLEARRQYRLSALVYAGSKSSNKNSGAYAEALQEHYAKASSYVRHEAKKQFKGDDALVYKIGNRFRVLPNQLINEKGDLVSKHDVAAFSVAISPGLEKILKETAYIDAHDDPRVIAAQHVVLEQARIFAKNKTGKADARSKSYQDEQLKFINTCVNLVNQETQNRGLIGQTHRMKRFHIFSRFKMPQLEAAMAKSAPSLYPEFKRVQGAAMSNETPFDSKRAQKLSQPGSSTVLKASSEKIRANDFNGLVVLKVPRSNRRLLVKLSVAPEKLRSITQEKLEKLNKAATSKKRQSEDIAVGPGLLLTAEDINIIQALEEKLKGNIFKRKFLKILEEKIQLALQRNDIIEPEYAEAFMDLIAEVELDKISRLVLKQIGEKLKRIPSQTSDNENQHSKRQRAF